MMCKKIDMDRWAQHILNEEGLSDWRFKWTGGGGLTRHEQKMIWCLPKDAALFLHEVSHALGSKEQDLIFGDKAGHHSCWADRYTDLIRKYLVGEVREGWVD